MNENSLVIAEGSGFQEGILGKIISLGRCSSLVRIPMQYVLDHFLPKRFFCNHAAMNHAFSEAQG